MLSQSMLSRPPITDQCQWDTKLMLSTRKTTVIATILCRCLDHLLNAGCRNNSVDSYHWNRTALRRVRVERFCCLLIGNSVMSGKVRDAPDVCVTVHPDTASPNRAWTRLKVKQTMSKVTPLDPKSPIRDDCVRFVCISDTHCQIEKLQLDFVPPGDVLLHGGDFSNVGLPQDIKQFNDYLGLLPHRRKVVIAGNHENTMDLQMVQTQRKYLKDRFYINQRFFEDYLHNLGLVTPRQLLNNCIYLEDSAVDMCGIKIYGSPWQPEFNGWGFGLDRGAPLLEVWKKIPGDTDILLTHTPPIGYGDLCDDGYRAGCVELLTTIQKRLKVKYHVYGHIHEDYGVLTDGHTTYINASTCDLSYKPTNPPIVFDFPIPQGHTKDELALIPPCNL